MPSLNLLPFTPLVSACLCVSACVWVGGCVCGYLIVKNKIEARHCFISALVQPKLHQDLTTEHINAHCTPNNLYPYMWLDLLHNEIH